MMTLQHLKAGGRRAALLCIAATALLLVIAHQGEAGAAGGKAKVKVVSFAFKPGTLSVNRGTKVVFANTSNVTHTATGKTFDTKKIAPGTSKAVSFNQAGTFSYHCKIHPFMHGKIVVH